MWVLAVAVCLSVHLSVYLSQVNVLLKWLNVRSHSNFSKTQTGHSNGDMKCRWGRLIACAVSDNWLGDFQRETLSASFGDKFITVTVHLICLQHVHGDAACRAGLSARADPCPVDVGLATCFFIILSPVPTEPLHARCPSCHPARAFWHC